LLACCPCAPSPPILCHIPSDRHNSSVHGQQHRQLQSEPSHNQQQQQQTASKPFQCTICDATFGRKGVWKKHIQITHEGIRKFECDFDGCYHSFGLKSDLKRHTSSVHLKQRPFECDVCTASFGRKSDLKRHFHSLHPGHSDSAAGGESSQQH
jgi:Zinc finger, C2H2 type